MREVRESDGWGGDGRGEQEVLEAISSSVIFLGHEFQGRKQLGTMLE